MILDLNEMQKKASDMLRAVDDICIRNNITYFVMYGTLLGAIRHQGPIPWDYDVDILVPESELERFVSVMDAELPDDFRIHFRKEDDHPRCFPRIGLAGYKTETLHVDAFRLCGMPAEKKMQKRIKRKAYAAFVKSKAKVVDIAYYYNNRLLFKVLAKVLRFLLLKQPVSRFIEDFDRCCQNTRYEFAENVCQLVGRPGSNILFEKDLFCCAIRVPYLDFEVNVPVGYEEILHRRYGNYMELPPLDEQEAPMKRKYEVREL